MTMRCALPLLLLSLTAAGCTATSHSAVPSKLGRASTTEAMLESLKSPGPLKTETVASADWKVDRAGLINLEHERARAAGLTKGDEPIQLYFHAIRHPRHGLFIIDTGVERALRDAPERALLSGLLAKVMKPETMTIRQPLGEFLEREAAGGERLAGVFLTHLHFDHITGLPDVPREVPVYTGPGETSARSLQHLVIRGTTNRAFRGMGPVQEWPYAEVPPTSGTSDAFDGVVDVFGDGSLWAVWVPGHSPGSTAYIARTAEGPVLFSGDACHTRWGWDHAVEPGTFSDDGPRSAENLRRLKALVASHPGMQVRLGHQP